MKMWKVEIRLGGAVCKRHFYESEKAFNKWFVKHKSTYEPMGYTVTAVVTDIDWSDANG